VAGLAYIAIDKVDAWASLLALPGEKGIHVKALHEMFGPTGNPAVASLSGIIACL
jgi:hypothetical protein